MSDERTTHEQLLPLVDRLFAEKIKPKLKPGEPEFELINPATNSTYSIRISWTGIVWRRRGSDGPWADMSHSFEATIFLLENMTAVVVQFTLQLNDRRTHAEALSFRAGNILDEWKEKE